MSTWESIFTQSPVNDGYYDEQDLPHQRWQWPNATWFQARRDFIRERNQPAVAKSARRIRNIYEMRTM